jgi:hypothetical protein
VPGNEGDEVERIQHRLRELAAERINLERRLAEISQPDGWSQAQSLAGAVRPQVFSSGDKVALFKQLFAARPDVFAIRWENSRDGRSGYAPACANEWKRGVCGKPQLKCGECPNQAFIPLSADILEGHLRGRHPVRDEHDFVVGVYVLSVDETCWFVAVDFDGVNWAEVEGRQLSMPAVYAAIAQDAMRNEMIFNDVLTALEQGRCPIVLTERRDHLDFLEQKFGRFARNVVVLKGGMTQEARKEAGVMLSASSTGERLVLATGRYLGEGFDDSRLDTLFLTMPISWKGTLAQYVGRLHRKHHDKTYVTVYDYVDHRVPMLSRMAARRQTGYRAWVGLCNCVNQCRLEWDADHEYRRERRDNELFDLARRTLLSAGQRHPDAKFSRNSRVAIGQFAPVMRSQI